MTTEVLRSLYDRAVHAFAFSRRDVSLTHTLLQSAFSILHPPVSFPDPLTEFRRKWDMLRITLETIVYTSSPSSIQKDLPDELKKMLIASPRALLQLMYSRSLTLFTPTGCAPTPAYLPGRVLLTLVYSSINMNCYDSGRYMIEEWLARRDPLLLPDSIPVGPRQTDTYWKVLESYCLHILPNLEQWDYAREFLEHETELPDSARQELKISLEALHAGTLDARKTPKPQPRRFIAASAPSSYRPASPTPSTSSSSSFSTASSTHTVKPSNIRGRRNLNGLSSLSALPSASASSTSLSSDTTAKPGESLSPPETTYTNGHVNQQHHQQPNGSHHLSKLSSGTNRSSSSSSHPSSSSSSPWLPFVSYSQAATCDPSNPGLYALVKKTLTFYLTPQKLSTLLIIFVLFPVISFILRFRHKRRKLLAGGGGASANGGVTPLINGPNGALASNADLVRKRLQHIGAGGDGLVQQLWAEVVRMVADTVKMAGSGLV